MDVPSHAEVVEQIDGFLARHSMKPSRLGRDAFGEASFVADVRKGRMPGLERLLKLSEFMRDRDKKAGGSSMAAQGSAAAARPHRLNAGAR